MDYLRDVLQTNASVNPIIKEQLKTYAKYLGESMELDANDETPPPSLSSSQSALAVNDAANVNTNRSLVIRNDNDDEPRPPPVQKSQPRPKQRSAYTAQQSKATRAWNSIVLYAQMLFFPVAIMMVTLLARDVNIMLKTLVVLMTVVNIILTVTRLETEKTEKLNLVNQSDTYHYHNQ